MSRRATLAGLRPFDFAQGRPDEGDWGKSRLHCVMRRAWPSCLRFRRTRRVRAFRRKSFAPSCLAGVVCAQDRKAGCISWREGRGHPARWRRPRDRRIREYGAGLSSLPSSQACRTLSPSRFAGNEMQPALRLPEPAEPDSGILEEAQWCAGSDFGLWGSHAVLLMGRPVLCCLLWHGRAGRKADPGSLALSERSEPKGHPRRPSAGRGILEEEQRCAGR